MSIPENPNDQPIDNTNLPAGTARQGDPDAREVPTDPNAQPQTDPNAQLPQPRFDAMTGQPLGNPPNNGAPQQRSISVSGEVVPFNGDRINADPRSQGSNVAPFGDAVQQRNQTFTGEVIPAKKDRLTGKPSTETVQIAQDRINPRTGQPIGGFDVHDVILEHDGFGHWTATNLHDECPICESRDEAIKWLLDEEIIGGRLVDPNEQNAPANAMVRR